MVNKQRLGLSQWFLNFFYVAQTHTVYAVFCVDLLVFMCYYRTDVSRSNQVNAVFNCRPTLTL